MIINDRENYYIKGELNKGIELIKNIKKIDLLILDEESVFTENILNIKNILSNKGFIIVYGEKELDCNVIAELQLDLVDKIELKNKYIYIYNFGFNKNLLNINFLNVKSIKYKENDISLLDIDVYLIYILNGILRDLIIYNTKDMFNVLDLTVSMNLSNEILNCISKNKNAYYISIGKKNPLFLSMALLCNLKINQINIV